MFFFVVRKTQIGEFSVDIVYTVEREIHSCEKFLRQGVVAFAVYRVRVAVNYESHARVDNFAPLFVRKVSFFGVYLDIRAVIGAYLRDFDRVSITQIPYVSQNVYRVVFYGVYVAARVVVYEPFARRTFKHRTEYVSAK